MVASSYTCSTCKLTDRVLLLDIRRRARLTLFMPVAVAERLKSLYTLFDILLNFCIFFILSCNWAANRSLVFFFVTAEDRFHHNTSGDLILIHGQGASLRYFYLIFFTHVSQLFSNSTFAQVAQQRGSIQVHLVFIYLLSSRSSRWLVKNQ